MITENAVHSEKILINAPDHLVWKILIDFENYAEWNTFTPSIKSKLEMGAAVDMQVDLGQGLQNQVEYICRIDENKAIAWAAEFGDKETLYACRTQFIEKITDNSCYYMSVDEFSGKMTTDVVKFQGKNIEIGFNRCAIELKAYAEKLCIKG